MSIRNSELLQAEAPLSLGALIHEHVAAGHRTTGGEEFAIAMEAQAVVGWSASRSPDGGRAPRVRRAQGLIVRAPGWRSDRVEAELPQSRVRERANQLFEVRPTLT